MKIKCIKNEDTKLILNEVYNVFCETDTYYYVKLDGIIYGLLKGRFEVNDEEM